MVKLLNEYFRKKSFWLRVVPAFSFLIITVIYIVLWSFQKDFNPIEIFVMLPFLVFCWFMIPVFPFWILTDGDITVLICSAIIFIILYAFIVVTSDKLANKWLLALGLSLLVWISSGIVAAVYVPAHFA